MGRRGLEYNYIVTGKFSIHRDEKIIKEEYFLKKEFVAPSAKVARNRGLIWINRLARNKFGPGVYLTEETDIVVKRKKN